MRECRQCRFSLWMAPASVPPHAVQTFLGFESPCASDARKHARVFGCSGRWVCLLQGCGMCCVLGREGARTDARHWRAVVR